MDLCILDAYSIIHTGSSHRLPSDVFQKMPTSGLRYLFSYITREIADGKDIVVVFDFKGDKYFGTTKNMPTELTGYKSNRIVDNSILVQCRFAFELCTLAGIKCFKTPLMEADSVIYNVTEMARTANKYNNIYIHSADYDLVHNVLFDTELYVNVMFVAVNSNVNSISNRNFESSIYPGVRIFNNTISAYKVFTRDKSDNIHTFPRGKELYAKYIDVIASLSKSNPTLASPKYNRSKNVFDAVIEYFKSTNVITDEQYKILIVRANTIFPKEFKNYPTLSVLTFNTFSDSNIYSVNKANLASILKACGSPVQTYHLKHELKAPINSTIIEAFKSAGNDYVSGKFAASLSKPMTGPNIFCHDISGFRGIIE